MHRTTTTATLLVTVAVTALSGCMTVQRAPASGSPSGTGVTHPDSKAKPQIVQAPAREGLERVGPSRKPSPDAAARHRATPPPQAPPAAAPVVPPQRSRPAPHTEPRHPKPRAARPPGTSDLPKGSDLCALGRKYGGWTADSPETAICAKTYGH